MAARAPARRRPAAVIVKHANPCGVAVADDITERVRRGARVRPGLGVRRHRGRQPSGARLRWPRRSPGVHRGGDRARPTTTPRSRRSPRRRTCACSRPRPPSARGARPPHDRRRLARAARRHGLASTGRRGGSSRRRARPRSSGATSSSRGIVCAAVTSNAIVLVGDRQAVGIGAGQQNRVDSGAHRGDAGRRAAPEAGRARATPSSRSATASTLPPTPASPPSSSPAARCATTK